MTSHEVSNITGVSYRRVVQWAKNNGVNQVGIDGKFSYVWNDQDLQRFLNRSTKRGRPWPKPNEKE